MEQQTGAPQLLSWHQQPVLGAQRLIKCALAEDRLRSDTDGPNQRFQEELPELQLILLAAERSVINKT